MRKLLIILLVVLGCDGPGGIEIVYAPHTVLDIPVVADVDGTPDIADPMVIKVGETWYLYATNAKTGQQVWSSGDLSVWRDEGMAWQPTPGSWNAGGQVWAPHVHLSGGKYYLYYTANMMVGVAVSGSPTGPFEEVLDHPLVGGGFGGVGDGVFAYADSPNPLLDFQEFSIDAFLLETGDGELYLYSTRYTPLSEIQVIRMENLVTPSGEPPVVVAKPDVFSWEALVNEGPWVEEHGGRYYLSYSGNGADLENYALGMAVGDQPAGPFEKLGTNPFLHKNPDADFWGPGHHCIVDGAFGDRLLFYHTKVFRDEGFERRLRYVPVSYDDQGVFGLDVPHP